MQIGFDDFLKVDIRIGTIIKAELRTDTKKPAFAIQIDFGESIGIKKTSAQVTDLYTEELLVGKQVAAVVNFPPKQVGKMMSEVLLLGFSNDKEQVVLFKMDHTVPNGARLH